MDTSGDPPGISVGGFPKLLSFRTMLERADGTCNDSTHALFDGVHTEQGPAAVACATQWKADHPDGLVMVHSNAGYCDPTRTTSSLENFLPAVPWHWLYLMGSETISTGAGSTIGADDTQVYVTDATTFHFDPSFCGSAWWTPVSSCAQATQGDCLLHATMTSVDSQGQADFSPFEHVEVYGYGEDAEGQFLCMNRALLGEAESFDSTASRVYINERSPDWRWVHNTSLMAPLDNAGQASPWSMAKHFSDWTYEKFPELDGLQFDMARSTPEAYLANFQLGEGGLDCDLDGVVDHCYDQGRNMYAAGVGEFLRLLRVGSGDSDTGLGDGFAALPERALLIADHGLLAMRHLNGSEFEHFPGFSSTAYERIGEALSDLRTRVALAGAEPKVSYSFTKESTSAFRGDCAAEPEATNARYRLGLVAALLSDAYFAFTPGLAEEENGVACGPEREDGPQVIDEYFAGTAQVKNFLGKPLGEWERAIANNSAILDLDPIGNLADWSVSTLQGVSMSDPGQVGSANLARLGVSVTSLGSEKPEEFGAVLLSPEFTVSKGEALTLRFSARSKLDGGDRQDAFDGMLRPVGLRLVSGDTNIGRVSAQSDARRWNGEVATGEETQEWEMRFVADLDTSQAQIAFGVGRDVGSFELEAVSVDRGCSLALWRPFEGGAVLFNGCDDQSAEFDLSKLDSERDYAFIEGEVTPEVNTGEPVVEPVSVPALDARVLRLDE